MPIRRSAVPSQTEGLAPSGCAAGFNVLLVTLDTLRRDRLGCYDYAAAKTPNLDRLAADGVLFEDAVSSVPLTLPSHATILTGLYPPHHGVRDNGRYHLPGEVETLAERLKEQGYATAAFLGCFVLDARFGLDQGFDVYDFEVTPGGQRPQMPDFNERPAEAVTDRAVEWLDGREPGSPPFFAWVHYFDPHLPYRSPLQRQPGWSGDPYDAEIAYVDQQIGRLMDRLDSLGQKDRTVVVVVADHGEMLGEHGERTHGLLIYESAIRVPFILSAPEVLEQRRVEDRVVGLVDVRATIEDLLGLEPAPGDGQSLLSPGQVDRSIYVETEGPFNQAGWSPLRGIRTRTAKYIDAPQEEFYDLVADRAERSNLFLEGDPDAAQSLYAQLAQYPPEWGGGPAARSMSAEELSRLSALGYVRSEALSERAHLADPKVMMVWQNRAAQAEQLYAQRKYQEAADLAGEVHAACKGCVQATRVMAFALLRLGRENEAVEVLRDAVKRKRSPFLVRSLAQAMILAGRCSEVEAVLKLYTSVDPTDGRVHILRGDCLARAGRHAEALAEYESAIQLDQNRSGPTARRRIKRMRAQGSAE